MLQRGNVKRFSVSLPPSLVEEFDETWRGMEYENRSKAVHDAIRGFISGAQWSKQASGEMVGVVLALVYLDRQGLVEDITSLLHGFKGVIVSMQRLYVEENKMLEIIGVKGDVGEIKGLVQGLMALKGVKQAASSIMAL